MMHVRGGARRGASLLLALIVVVVSSARAQAQRLDDDHRARGEAIAHRLEHYLLSEQDPASGGWRVNPNGVNFPAITGLVVNALMLDPDADAQGDAISRAVEYLLSQQQDDGGIYDTVLPSYNTSISISALSHVDTKRAHKAVEKALEFLLTLQWSDGSDGKSAGPGAQVVGADHPYFGGVGYGTHSRPDASNLAFFLQALDDAGYEHDGPAVQRAMVFLSRIQMDDQVNDMAYAKGSKQGGFIYSTGSSEDTAGQGESKAGMIEETLDDGTSVSRLRAYGSMTYAGFKSYAYAELDDHDPRVLAARRWIAANYTLDENPGMGPSGFYYYLLVFGRSMDAWDESAIQTATGERQWANDLIDRLEGLITEDGSARSIDDRWMESDPVLISAYSLIALRHALNN